MGHSFVLHKDLPKAGGLASTEWNSHLKWKTVLGLVGILSKKADLIQVQQWKKKFVIDVQLQFNFLGVKL